MKGKTSIISKLPKLEKNLKNVRCLIPELDTSEDKSQ